MIQINKYILVHRHRTVASNLRYLWNNVKVLCYAHNVLHHMLLYEMELKQICKPNIIASIFTSIFKSTDISVSKHYDKIQNNCLKVYIFTFTLCCVHLLLHTRKVKYNKKCTLLFCFKHFFQKSPMQMRIIMHSFVWNLYNCFSHMAQCVQI